jgi:hypothetical protein
MAVDPAVDAAVDPALADVPVAEAATLYAADGTPGHHHHRRQLLQTGLEWESAWLVSTTLQQCTAGNAKVSGVASLGVNKAMAT